MQRLIHGLEARLTWTSAALGFGVIVLSNVVMAGYLLPSIEARRPQALDDGFLRMIDLAPLRPAADVYAIFDLYTPDILGYVRMLYAVDFVFPAGFALVAAVLIHKLLRYLGVTEGAWRAAVLVPFAALPFDYIENVFALVLSSLYQGGAVYPTLALVAGVATALKFACLIVSGLTLVTLLIRAVARRFSSRA